MQSYELMTICRCDEDAYQGAREAVKSEIAKVNGTVVKEEELGERLLLIKSISKIAGNTFFSLLT